MSRAKFLCKTCSVDTGKIGEHYFINTDLWVAVTGSIKGMYCIGCFETLLGRKLTKKDFTDCHLNNVKLGFKSNRFLERMIS